MNHLKLQNSTENIYKYTQDGTCYRNKSESDYKKLLRDKWEYYSGKSEVPFEEKPLKVLKQDIPMYLESDEDLIKAKHKVDYHNAMCDFAENVMKMMNNRGFQIKNAIDWKRFLEGSL